jgi:hypothetical protein
LTAPPNHTAAEAAFAALGTWALLLTGLPYLAIFWGGVGAFFALLKTKQQGRWAATASLVVATLIGAAFGAFLARRMGGEVEALFLLSLLGGAGAKPLVSAGIAALVNRTNKLGGE